MGIGTVSLTLALHATELKKRERDVLLNGLKQTELSRWRSVRAKQTSLKKTTVLSIEGQVCYS